MRRGRCGGRSASSRRSWRTPSIIEAWLSSSERITQFGQQLGDGRDRRLVGDEAGGEDQRRFLAVQVGELAPRARPAGGWCRRCCGCRRRRRPCRRPPRACAAITVGVLAHAEIVVGAPDGDLAWRLPCERQMACGKRPAMRSMIGEDAIAPLGVDLADRFLEKTLVVHVGNFPFGWLPVLARIILSAVVPSIGPAWSKCHAVCGLGGKGCMCPVHSA